MNVEFKKRPSDIHKFANEMHQRAKKAGFWEVNLSNEHYLCLVISELMEAVQADRISKRFNKPLYDKIVHIHTPIEDLAEEGKLYVTHIKGTIEEELADSVIRLLDLAGARNLDIGRFALSHIVSESNSFTENIFSICKELAYYKHSLSEQINYAILEIERLCKIMSIDLWLHVELKMRYNLTREYKHGKKY